MNGNAHSIQEYLERVSDISTVQKVICDEVKFSEWSLQLYVPCGGVIGNNVLMLTDVYKWMFWTVYELHILAKK